MKQLDEVLSVLLPLGPDQGKKSTMGKIIHQLAKFHFHRDGESATEANCDGKDLLHVSCIWEQKYEGLLQRFLLSFIFLRNFFEGHWFIAMTKKTCWLHTLLTGNW